MKEISAAEVEQRLEKGEQLRLIDVRETSEVAEGHIPDAINIPLGLLEFRIHELDKNTPYIIVCRSGGRSGKATEYLTSFGYDAVNMIGGMLEWQGKIKV
ncbi:rhodanese-like domain-containing protein [Paenibacillus sp. IITD108]|uniref:rhodanese-like domain-containing protein n=1 Tax=Paenibacillus sp. IITD108 TaxID=3116649 RepID=UPI002F412069